MARRRERAQGDRRLEKLAIEVLTAPESERPPSFSAVISAVLRRHPS